MKTKKYLYTAVIIALLALSTSAVSLVSACASTAITLSPPQGYSVVLISGISFAPCKDILITYDGVEQPTVPLQVKSDSKGMFSAVIAVPDVSAIGGHTIVASDGHGNFASAVFTVLSAVGPKGDTGATGAQGPQGATGAQGPKGDTGETGPQGEQGLPGIQGEQGIQGIAGVDGVNGTNGVDGKDGVNGTNGKDGLNGARGEQGPIGFQGTEGVQGQQGAKGDTGATGKDGSSVVNAGVTTGVSDMPGLCLTVTIGAVGAAAFLCGVVILAFLIRKKP